MQLLLLLIFGLVAYVMFSAHTKAQARMHYANCKRAIRDVENRVGPILPSWARDSAKAEMFANAVLRGTKNSNIPEFYVRFMMSEAESRHLLMCFVASLERQGSTFTEQVIGISDFIRDMFHKLNHADQAKAFALSATLSQA